MNDFGYGAASITTQYRVVTRTVRKKAECQGGCGQRLDRQRTFSQTINPFNRNPDGTPKNYAQVWESLGWECDEWEPQATCKSCQVDVVWLLGQEGEDE